MLCFARRDGVTDRYCTQRIAHNHPLAQINRNSRFTDAHNTRSIDRERETSERRRAIRLRLRVRAESLTSPVFVSISLIPPRIRSSHFRNYSQKCLLIKNFLSLSLERLARKEGASLISCYETEHSTSELLPHMSNLRVRKVCLSLMNLTTRDCLVYSKNPRNLGERRRTCPSQL